MVYIAEKSAYEILMAQYASMFSAVRKQKSLRYAKRDDAMMGELAECLLLALVQVHAPTVQLPLDIYIGEYGKPHLKNDPVHFSLSHTDTFAVAAVSDAPIGADIELCDRAAQRMLSRIRHPSETDMDLDATALFSAKESITKRTGQGMHTPFSSVCISDHPVMQTVISDHILSVCCDSFVKVHLWNGSEFSPICDLRSFMEA